MSVYIIKCKWYCYILIITYWTTEKIIFCYRSSLWLSVRIKINSKICWRICLTFCGSIDFGPIENDQIWAFYAQGKGSLGSNFWYPYAKKINDDPDNQKAYWILIDNINLYHAYHRKASNSAGDHNNEFRIRSQE